MNSGIFFKNTFHTKRSYLTNIVVYTSDIRIELVHYKGRDHLKLNTTLISKYKDTFQNSEINNICWSKANVSNHGRK